MVTCQACQVPWCSNPIYNGLRNIWLKPASVTCNRPNPVAGYILLIWYAMLTNSSPIIARHILLISRFLDFLIANHPAWYRTFYDPRFLFRQPTNRPTFRTVRDFEFRKHVWQVALNVACDNGVISKFQLKYIWLGVSIGMEVDIYKTQCLPQDLLELELWSFTLFWWFTSKQVLRTRYRVGSTRNLIDKFIGAYLSKL